MNSLSRRRLLQSLGLGAGALMLGPRFLRHAAAEDSAPRRFVFVVEGNGFVPKVPLTTRPGAPRHRTEQPIGKTGGGLEIHPYRTAPHRHTRPRPGHSPWRARRPRLTDRASVIYGLSSRNVGGGHSGRHGAELDLERLEAHPVVRPSTPTSLPALAPRAP